MKKTKDMDFSSILLNEEEAAPLEKLFKSDSAKSAFR